jgi:hypothetical protein
VQLFSLALFPVLIALLRSEARDPSRRIWLVVPLLAVWWNLHGMALAALGITGTYLILGRLRSDRATAIGVGAASLLSIFLTPVGWRAITYYQLSLTNVGVQRGEGLWAPLSLTSVFDVMLILAVVTLITYACRRPRPLPPLWEIAVLLILVLMTINASRSGVWLAFFLVGPAAHGLQLRRRWARAIPPLATVGVVVLALAIIRGPLPSGGTHTFIARAIALAHGTPVLADDVLAEQVALAGGRVWVGNPIDAFSRQDQAAYLDWADGSSQGSQALRPQVLVVLTQRGGAAQRLMDRTPGFARVAVEKTAIIYERHI